MTATRDEQAAKILAGAPVTMQKTLQRAFDGQGGRQNAIKAMCLACAGFDRETVRNCTGWSCPLWIWRPFQSSSRRGPKSGVPE